MKYFINVLVAVFLGTTAFGLFSPQACANQFQNLRFNNREFERYGEFFDSSSTITLAEAGTFKGADSIEEYVRFATKDSPFFLQDPVENIEFQFAGFDAQKETCRFLLGAIVSYDMDGNNALSNSHKLSVMQRIVFDSKKNKINSIVIYYSEKYLEFFFTKLLNTKQTMKFICNTMKDFCPSVYSQNKIFSISDCVFRMSRLPPLTNGYADGNDLGCRALHSTLILKNQFHCPHISFITIPDDEGAIKCQSSGEILVSSLFIKEDFDFYRNYSKTNGIDPDVGFKILCQDSMTWRISPSSSFGCNYIRSSRGFCSIKDAEVACSSSCSPLCSGNNRRKHRTHKSKTRSKLQ